MGTPHCTRQGAAAADTGAAPQLTKGTTVFKSKQDKTEYRNLRPDMPPSERQIRAMFAKIDNISNRLDKASSWAKELEQKLDTVLDCCVRQSVQPVEAMEPVITQAAKAMGVTLISTPDEVTPDADPDKLENIGKLRRVYYSKDPVTYIERKIYNATSAHKTATCIFLSALLTAVNSPSSNRREQITASKLVEHLLELLADKRIIAVKAKPRKTKVLSGDIGFQLASSENPVLDRYSIISEEEATEVLSLFVRWSNG